MLFELLNAIQQRNPVLILAILIAIVVILLSIAVHESAHAFVAYYLGDMTPRYQGRLTLNPLAHLDPFGTLLILIAGVGYGRPVQFNPFALRMDRRWGMALVALAGPLTNVLLGIVFGLSLRALFALGSFSTSDSLLDEFIVTTFSLIIILNFSLAIFNMIPFPPLDGSKVLLALLPPPMANSVERFYYQSQQYMLIVVLLLIYFGGRFIGPLISGPAQALYSLIVGTPS